ncbi:NUDIX domain-containing protein [Candidatus Woesearchaeota archaeon]|nr:NUDIX domain-containing protein [Candidatus Woesearchaeota archaeon]
MGKVPRVGVGVFVLKNGKFLIGKRINAHGEGSWSLPGGHLEFNEELEDCAKREVIEETNVNIKKIKVLTVTNDIFKKEGKHYITIFLLSDYESGDVKVMEPEKCQGWRWVSWEDIPKPMFLPLENMIKQGTTL